MKQPHGNILIKILLVVGATTALTGLALAALVALPPASPASAAPVAASGDAQPAPEPPPARPLLNLAMTLSAQTQSGGNGSSIRNGETITYRISVTNTSGAPINNITIRDVLPKRTLSNITCLDPCTEITTPQVVIIGRDENTGDPITDTVFILDQLEWSGFSLGPGLGKTVAFTALVSCQPNGAQFTNSVFVASQNPVFNNEASLQTTVFFDLQGQAKGAALMPDQPSWCSEGESFANDLDWGDFDNDGDLDLVLGTSGRVVVYQNEGGGRLTPLPPVRTGTTATGVRWADVNKDGVLELVTVGHYNCVPNCFTGQNYIDRWDGTTFVQTGVFTSDDGLAKIAAADYNRDGNLDLGAGTFWPFGGIGDCKLRLYRGNGANDPFTDQDNAINLCLLPGDGISVPSLAWGDFDNDGFPDLAAGTSNGQILLFVNSGAGNFFAPGGTPVATGLPTQVFDLAWGDYDRDGFLDLAAAYVSTVAIYRNDQAGGFDPPIQITTNATRAIDWADFNGDGRLELAVASNTGLKIYRPQNPAGPLLSVDFTSSGGSFSSIQAADYDNDGDVDIAASNPAFSSDTINSRSVLFTGFAPFLNSAVTPLADPSPLRAGSLALGEVNGDNAPDLLLGAGSGFFGSKLYFNQDGGYSSLAQAAFNGFGLHSVGLGDVNGDGLQDVAIGTFGQERLYLASNLATAAWNSSISDNTFSLLLADFDLDNGGRLDLLTGNGNSPNLLYLNQGSQLAADPAWQTALNRNTRSVAWGYFDDDIFPDFAVGNSNQPNQVYRNNGNYTFSPINWNPPAFDTRSVAWGDWDQDGRMDLAVGNFNQRSQVYRNLGGSLSASPVWSSPTLSATTGLAWGDWDNDGDLDLALGNRDQKDQVFLNLELGGQRDLIWVWSSADALKTTGIAWVDKDGDGDLDLAISREDVNSSNGIYENSYTLPAHLDDIDFTREMPLPQNPAYLSINRPGQPDQVWTRPVLTNPASLVIPINFTVFDPDGLRSVANPAGDSVELLSQEYSLDGGGAWQNATISGLSYNGATQRQGVAGSFNWRAGQDLNSAQTAVSDSVQFRITLARKNSPVLAGQVTAPVQRVVAGAASPIFRVRNLSCIWPGNVSITTDPAGAAEAGQQVKFVGSAIGGGNETFGQIFFDWAFGDGVTATGHIVFHSYLTNGPHVVTLTVRGVPCPVTRSALVSTVINISGAEAVYLPLIRKSGGNSGTIVASPQPETSAPAPTPARPALIDLNFGPDSPAPPNSLLGSIESGGTALQWEAGAPAGSIVGYRLYRAAMGTVAFQPLAEIPASATGYVDPGVSCGQTYFVTAYNAKGESLPSTNSYFSPPCP